MTTPLPEQALAWMDRFWDPAVRMLTYPSRQGSASNPYQQPKVPIVRETATYAVGLLARNGAGDAERGAEALAEVLRFQIDDRKSVCHGTWRRSPLEPAPGERPREWIDYDHNWREFVGTALVLALECFETALPRGLVARIERALSRAAEGTFARGVPAEYTNIALMSAFLLDWVGSRLEVPEWRARGDTLAREVARDYRAAGAFPEHNSPTYYGIDLYGAALWRAHAASRVLRGLGSELEEALWRDLARFYHADLRNLCGPYTRAYGMDMTRYVASLGTWIAAVLRTGSPPLPAFGDAVPHAHDFCELVWIGLLGSRPPEDVRAALTTFPGEHLVEQVITAKPRRVATSWLAADVMLGGEHTGGRVIHWQHHPATLHWRLPAHQAVHAPLGWLRLVTNAPVDAVAERGRLDIQVHTGLAWLREAEIQVWIEGSPAPGRDAPLRNGATWDLPGLRVGVSLEGGSEPTNAPGALPGSGRTGFVFAPGEAPSEVRIGLSVATTAT
jgi:hypothetical protein